MKIKKRQEKRLKKQFKVYGNLLICTLTLLLISTILLVGLPRFIHITESKALISSNATGMNKEEAIVVPQEKKIVTKIHSLGIKPPPFSASAVIAKDLQTGQILYQENIHSRLAPASTTKIMTAIVSSDIYKPASVLNVTQKAIVGGSTMGLSVGEQLSFRSLLYGMMLNSGNDAAYTIALNSPGGYEGFTSAMNTKAKELGLNNTHFDNPAGFDSPNHYSSAYDLAKIAEASISNPQLARVIATKETSVSDWEDKSKSHSLKNLNKLLNEEGVLGIKTGTTEKAGESFVGLVEREGHKVLTVVLNSDDRFGETKELMDWVYDNYDWQQVEE